MFGVMQVRSTLAQTVGKTAADDGHDRLSTHSGRSAYVSFRPIADIDGLAFKANNRADIRL